MQYFITYVLGYRSPSGKKAQLGTIFHKVMECLAACKKALQSNILNIEDEALGKIKFTEKSLYTKKFVDELLKQSYDYYTESCIHDYFSSDFKFCKEQIETTLKYNNGQFDPRNRNIVDTEPTFDIPIEEEWAKFEYKTPDGKILNGNLAIKGTVDLITKIDDKIIEVVDWKTGQRKNWATGEIKTYNSLLQDTQLLLYNYAISKLYPDYDQAIMSIFFTRDGGPFSLCFERSDHGLFLNKLKKRFEEIQKNENPKPICGDRNDFRCQKLCHFYKQNWPDTNIPMCFYIENKIKSQGYEKTVSECKDKNFDISYYKAPGSA